MIEKATIKFVNRDNHSDIEFTDIKISKDFRLEGFKGINYAVLELHKDEGFGKLEIDLNHCYSDYSANISKQVLLTDSLSTVKDEILETIVRYLNAIRNDMEERKDGMAE